MPLLLKHSSVFIKLIDSDFSLFCSDQAALCWPSDHIEVRALFVFHFFITMFTNAITFNQALNQNKRLGIKFTQL